MFILKMIKLVHAKLDLIEFTKYKTCNLLVDLRWCIYMYINMYSLYILLNKWKAAIRRTEYRMVCMSCERKYTLPCLLQPTNTQDCSTRRVICRPSATPQIIMSYLEIG